MTLGEAKDVARACVIGAGSSGIVAAKMLADRDVEFDWFEMGSFVGGNWRYGNDNGVSSTYRSLHINTSREQMQYADFPMPADYPDFASHELLAKYFDGYVDHFGLREKISFRHKVLSIEPIAGGGPGGKLYRRGQARWRIAVEPKEGEAFVREYTDVIVANGHHWDPRWPEPPFPGAEDFEGEQMHVHYYREADILEGKRVLVLGIGNSACDIAVESSRIADRTFMAMRRGAYVMPKYFRGMPLDALSSPLTSKLPLWIQRKYIELEMKWAVGDMTRYGLPKPDHKMLQAHPTVSSELLPRLGHGDITVKSNVERLGPGRTVRFVDGSEEEIDLIIYCTGYKISFPFLDPALYGPRDNQLNLFHHVVAPDLPGLYFVGFIQPLGAVMPLVEHQSRWIADLVRGAGRLPSRRKMKRAIRRQQAKMARRYVASKRHTIEVDFYPYRDLINREHRRSLRRAGAS